MPYETPEELEKRMLALQTSIDDVLERLPAPSRLGIASVRLIPGTQVGQPFLAVDTDVAFDGGAPRRFAARSHAWIDGYFDGKGRTEGCRSLLFPPDILVFVQPTLLVETVTPDSIVRGILCYLRHEGATPTCDPE